MKRTFLTLLALLMVLVCAISCSPNTDELKVKFDGYTPNSNVVAVLDNTVFYFADHTLNLRGLSEKEEPNGGYTFIDGKLYFSVSKQNAAKDFSFLVYTCDIYGNNKTLIFEKQGYKTKPWAVGKHNVFYLEHYTTHALDTSAHNIDSFNILTGAYETVSTAEDSTLADYKRGANGRYSCTLESDTITIVDSQKNMSYRVDNKTLQNSELGETLADLDYFFCNYEVTNDGRMYLIYRIKSNGAPYPHFICEYIPDTDKVAFSLLFFTYDVENIDVAFVDVQ